MRTIVTTLVLGVALLGAAGPAAAFGMRGGPGGPGGPGGGPGVPLRLLLAQFSPDQRQQARQIFLADRTDRQNLMKQMRDAHQALADRMFAAGALTEADLAPQIQKIAALHQQLLEHGTAVMLKVRAIATPDQLAKAATAQQKLSQLHDEIHGILGDPAGVEDVPE